MAVERFWKWILLHNYIKRLIKAVAECKKTEIIDALLKVYNSVLSSKIDDYNSSMYYENSPYLLECYLENKVI